MVLPEFNIFCCDVTYFCPTKTALEKSIFEEFGITAGMLKGSFAEGSLKK